MTLLILHKTKLYNYKKFYFVIFKNLGKKEIFFFQRYYLIRIIVIVNFTFKPNPIIHTENKIQNYDVYDSHNSISISSFFTLTFVHIILLFCVTRFFISTSVRDHMFLTCNKFISFKFLTFEPIFLFNFVEYFHFNSSNIFILQSH